MQQTIDLFDLKETLNGKDILLCFNGPLSKSIIEELGTAMRRYLESEAVAKNQVSDVFSVYIEQAQNIRHYAAQRGRDATEQQLLTNAIMVVMRQGETYTVSSGNLVAQTDVPALAGQLDRLAALDPAGLRALYKETLRQPRPEHAGSAGLGLISMARLAKRPLAYSLRPVDDRFAFFSLAASL